MKTYYTSLPILAIATLLLAIPSVRGQADSPADANTFSVVKVCQDDIVLHTSDGADAGHISYMIIDPSDERVVSAVVSGGFLAERLVPVPISVLRFGKTHEVTLVDIDRARLEHAPLVERDQLVRGVALEPKVIERSYTHFGVKSTSVALSKQSPDAQDAERRSGDTRNAHNTSENREQDRTANRSTDRTDPHNPNQRNENAVTQKNATERQSRDGNIKDRNTTQPGETKGREGDGNTSTQAKQGKSQQLKRLEENTDGAKDRAQEQQGGKSKEMKQSDQPPSAQHFKASQENAAADTPPAQKKSKSVENESSGANSKGEVGSENEKRQKAASEKKKSEDSPQTNQTTSSRDAQSKSDKPESSSETKKTGSKDDLRGSQNAAEKGEKSEGNKKKTPAQRDGN